MASTNFTCINLSDHTYHCSMHLKFWSAHQKTYITIKYTNNGEKQAPNSNFVLFKVMPLQNKVVKFLAMVKATLLGGTCTNDQLPDGPPALRGHLRPTPKRWTLEIY